MKTEIKPVLKKDRIEILDIIRGFAIMGILIANIQSWSGYKFIPFEMLRVLDYYEYNNILKHMFMIFVDTKFYAIFSMLFGIGFFLQFQKFRDNQKEFIATYRRRLVVLIFFGAIHAFFWSGDILMIYALVGFVFILFRNLEDKKLLFWSIVFYYIWLLKDVIAVLFFSDYLTQHQMTAYKTYTDMVPEGVAFFFQHGTVMEVLNTNWHNLFWRYVDLLPAGRLSKILALFLFGYYLMSIGYFKKAIYSKKLLLIFIANGLFFTILSDYIGGSMAVFSVDFKNVLYKLLAVTGQIFMALVYVNLLALLYEKVKFKKILHMFSYVGRMSFSNYIMHTVFGYLIFYPFFGQLFGTMGIAEITALAIVLYIVQIIYSYFWLKYFKFGPLEWLWRCLTYKQLFSIRYKK
jgi:uncharacterized protein